MRFALVCVVAVIALFVLSGQKHATRMTAATWSSTWTSTWSDEAQQNRVRTLYSYVGPAPTPSANAYVGTSPTWSGVWTSTWGNSEKSSRLFMLPPTSRGPTGLKPTPRAALVADLGEQADEVA